MNLLFLKKTDTSHDTQKVRASQAAPVKCHLQAEDSAHTLEATQKFSTSPCLEGKFQRIESLVRINDTVTRCLYMGTSGFIECEEYVS